MRRSDLVARTKERKRANPIATSQIVFRGASEYFAGVDSIEGTSLPMARMRRSGEQGRVDSRNGREEVNRSNTAWDEKIGLVLSRKRAGDVEKLVKQAPPEGTITCYGGFQRACADEFEDFEQTGEATHRGDFAENWRGNPNAMRNTLTT